MELSQILSSLPKLTSSELAIVVATSNSIISNGQNGRRQPSSKKNGQAKKQNKGKKKGPAKPASPYADIPEYQQFKTAEKEMKRFLKETSKKLSDFTDPYKDNLDNPDTSSLPKPLAGFFEARQCWFCAKINIKAQTSTVGDAKSSKTTEASKDAEKGKKRKGKEEKGRKESN